MSADDDDFWCDDPYDDDLDDMGIDVCQHCGGYFAWDDHHKKVSIETGFTNHQRCIRCMRDECWIERRDEEQEPRP